MAEPVGEDAWLAFVEEASRNASDLEQRICVVELYKKAISAEPFSCKIWLAYCEWVWSLHTDCQTADAGWPDEEQQLGQELFTVETALDVWQEGAQATEYRLNDSNEIWDRWVAIELERLLKSATPSAIDRVRKMFVDRLQIPHFSWEQTSQMFSTFITQYDEMAWETTMVRMTESAKHAKELYAQREDLELKLQQAAESRDKDAQGIIMREYIDWEVQQTQKKPNKSSSESSYILAVAIYERSLASTSLGLDASIWEDYLVFLSSISQGPQPNSYSVFSAAQRATAHCPWSGSLWARYILSAECDNRPFYDIEQIKHAATSNDVLDRDGLEAIMEVYIAWCGYLKRRTMVVAATDEDFDMADVGLPAAIESVEEWGKRLYGPKNYKGDPLFRMEQIVIQYFTEKGAIDQARAEWVKLIRSHGHGYDFWQQYYNWEMIVRNPKEPSLQATAVLNQAVRHKFLDWPEKIMEMYIRHCQNHVEAHTMLSAKDLVHAQAKIVSKRRNKEAVEAAASYAQQQAAVPDLAQLESPSGPSKRKRQSANEDSVGHDNKRPKNEQLVPVDEAQENLKRDRENTTILVTNLPAETEKVKLRQFFRDYGDINSITLRIEPDKLSSSALIEFRSHADVQSALLRDGKDFHGKKIHVEIGARLTLYITNYPPTADEIYMRNLFKHCGEIFSIRFPSLKYNTQRRFCYISFKNASAAAEATKLDGQILEKRYKLVAKYSDPSSKKSREGATAEGRELHVSGIDPSLTESVIEEVFAKYGKLEKINLLKMGTGVNKGAAFISFERKGDAEAALELDKTKLKSKILNVEVAVPKNFKPTATTREITHSASPAPTEESADRDAVAFTSQGPSESDSTSRMITLMNIPDTINDSRIRALAEPYGNITRLTLRPDHQGAIIVYEEVSSAGRAALGLDNHEIVNGRKLRVGGLKDLFRQKGEVKNDKIQIGQGRKETDKFIQPSAPVKRPGARGGLGTKRGRGGFSAARLPTSTKEEAFSNSKNNGENKIDASKESRSNDSFRAMFLGSR